MHIRVEDLTLFWAPCTLVHLVKLAILLSLADDVLDTLLDGLRRDLCVKGLDQFGLFAELGDKVSIVHLLLTDLKAAALRVESVQYSLNSLDEFVSLCNEIGLASKLNKGDQSLLLVDFHANETLRCGAASALFSISKTSLSEQLLCLFKISIGLSECLNAVLERGSGHITQLLHKF